MTFRGYTLVAFNRLFNTAMIKEIKFCSAEEELLMAESQKTPEVSFVTEKMSTVTINIT